MFCNLLQLADYRYGREEMLALYSKDVPPPDGLQNLGSLCIDHIQEPLAFLPINIDEQVRLSYMGLSCL